LIKRFASAAIAVVALATHLSAASFTVIPDLYNGKARMILQLMPDGKSLMGVAGDEVFRWTPGGGRTTLGNLGPRVIPTAVSADGSTVVGRQVSFSDQQAVRWSLADGLTVLPLPAEFPYNASPTQVSDDGSIVYGTAQVRFTRPTWDLYILGEIPNPDFDDIYYFGDPVAVFRWQSGVSSVLPAWTSAPLASYLQDISADGLTVAGSIAGSPTVWSESTGTVQPTSLPAPFFAAMVSKVSADGSTAVGDFFTERFGQRHAFRWTQGEKLQPLTDMTESYSDTLAISADGQLVLGRYDKQVENLAYTFVWSVDNGMQPLTEYFADHAFTFPFEGTHNAHEMSRDGLVFHGDTTLKNVGTDGTITYQNIPWIVDLTAPVAEPESILLLTAGLAGFACSRGKYRRDSRRRIYDFGSNAKLFAYSRGNSHECGSTR